MAHRQVKTVEAVKDLQRRSRLPARLFFWLAFLPPLLLGFLILKYGVDVMDWDQWKIAALFQKASNGALTFSDLTAQQGEFRQFFPNLIFLGLGSLTHWNIRYEMLVTFALACVVAFNLYGVARVTLGYSNSTQYFLAFLTGLLIFSPAQFENWLHGEQIIYLMPAACFTTALRVAYAGLGTKWTALLCMLLSTVATFSSPNGIVCWVVLSPVLFAYSDRGTRRDWRLVVWLAGFVLSLSLYLYGYHKPSFSPPLDAALRHPMESIFFFIALLGAPLLTSYRFGFVAASFGAVMTVLFVTSCAYVWKLQDRRERHCLLAWLMVGAYSFVTAIIVTIARVGYGADQAFSSRYGGFFVYLAVSLCWLAPRLLADLRKNGRLRDARLWKFRPEAVAAAGLMLIHSANSSYAIHEMGAMRMKGLQDKACLLLVNVVKDECLTNDLPALNVVRTRTNAMNELGYLRPRLIGSNRVRDITATSPEGSSPSGRFESLQRLADGNFEARGRARLPDSGEPAHAILLVSQNEGGEPLIFAIAEVAAPKFPLLGFLRGGLSGDGVWERKFSLNRLPAGPPVRISTWSFDALTGKAYPLEGSYVIVPGVAPR